jgi:hypothetical protein
LSDYYKVQLDGLWLSQDGLEPEEPNLACRVTIDGLEGLAMAEVGPIVKAISGKPWKFIQPNTGAGVDLVIKPLVLDPDVLDDLIDLIDSANSGDTLVNLVLADGELPDRDLLCRPGQPVVGYPGDFNDGRIYGVVINLTVDSFSPPPEP